MDDGGALEAGALGEVLSSAVGDDALAPDLLELGSTIASTMATIATTAAAEPPTVQRWRAFARAAARACSRRS